MRNVSYKKNDYYNLTEMEKKLLASIVAVVIVIAAIGVYFTVEHGRVQNKITLSINSVIDQQVVSGFPQLT